MGEYDAAGTAAQEYVLRSEKLLASECCIWLNTRSSHRGRGILHLYALLVQCITGVRNFGSNTLWPDSCLDPDINLLAVVLSVDAGKGGFIIERSGSNRFPSALNGSLDAHFARVGLTTFDGHLR